MGKNDSEFDEVLGGDGPDSSQDGSVGFKAPDGIWMRGLMMLILALMFGLAETVLAVVAVVQFLWMLFAKEKNTLLMGFGEDLAKWLAEVALFQSGATEDKPFPWAKWR
jgi:hypothetical protein